MSKKSGKKLLPCASCPWRTDQDASAILRYDQEKAEGLLSTVGDEDWFRPIMACHGSTDAKMVACKGYLAREGWSNLHVRLLLARGRIENPTAVADACEAHGIELEPDYPATLRKLSS
jgi:hypothetical protein